MAAGYAGRASLQWSDPLLKRLAVLFLLLAPPPALADPAVWVAHGPKATVYMLGSVHMLRPGTAWESAAVRRAYAEAQECWFEIVQPKDPAALQGLMMSTGLDPAHKLSDLLPPSRRAQFEAAADRTGLGPAVQMMRPWLTSMILVLQPLQQAGYDPALGVDTVLQTRAKADGKRVAGVETVEAQMEMLSGMPQSLALQMLTTTLDDVAQGPAYLDGVVQSWASGDTEGMARAVTGRVCREAPELYRRIFAKRNETFATAVEGFLRGDKTVLLVVGAGHLAGPDNVRDVLAQRGVKVERMAN